eukprot:227046-Rhodomonas_salina.1
MSYAKSAMRLRKFRNEPKITPLGAYALATRCPALTWATLLPGRGPDAAGGGCAEARERAEALSARVLGSRGCDASSPSVACMAVTLRLQASRAWL